MKLTSFLIFICLSFISNIFSQSGLLDQSFNVLDDCKYGDGSLFNSAINATAVQTDGKILVGGGFISYNGTSRNGIARLNIDGSIDQSFDPGTGFNAAVTTLSIQQDGKIVVGGLFTMFNGVTKNYLVRLNTDGSLDASFNSLGGGFNSLVYSTAIQSDGKIVVGGNFNSYNGFPKKYVTRLNSDGSIDGSFNTTGTGLNNRVRTLAIQVDGKIVLGGDFSNYNGTTRNRIVRINSDGTLDASFNPGTGFNNLVYSTSIQSDGKIVVGGNFTTYNGVGRNYISRLNTDGSNDVTFNIGTGFDWKVYTTSIQQDGKILVGGDFSAYNGNNSLRIARLEVSGSIDIGFNS